MHAPPFCVSSQPVILYWILINILAITFRVYFRRIYLVNASVLPKDKPVLLAPNHPNSFLDGVLLSVMLRCRLFIMARGDVFQKPLANWALRSMRVLPIFRAEDGAGNEQAAKNQQTYNECYEIFHRRGNVLIFPEGICVTERRLRPMKKGAAKMTFEAITKYEEMDLQIIPVGLNYSNPGTFREEVCINMGKPIAAKEYLKLLQDDNQPKAVTDFNTRLFDALERELVIIKEPANDLVGAQYLQIARNHYKPSFWGFVKTTKKRFLAEKRAAGDLNQLYESDPERFESFKGKILDYYAALDEARIKDRYFSFLWYEKIGYLLFTLLFFIPASIGLVLNFLPVVLAKRVADKTVKRIEFYDSVNIGAGAIFALLHFILWLAVLIPFFGWYGILMTIGIRLLGWLYLFWYEAAGNTLYWMRVLFTSKGRTLNLPLQSQRKFILGYFDQA